MSTLESAEHGAAGNANAYGNPLGLAVLLDFDNEIFKKDIETLKIAAEGYRKIRNRFLDVFRRDVIDNLDHKGRHNIAKGNEAAHYGDAIADAALYTSRERSDYDVMRKIYGLSPGYITSLAKAGNSDTIKAINAGATWRANQFTTAVPPEVEAAFQTFHDELELSQNSNDESLTDGTTRLSKAYYAFWTAHKVHKAHKDHTSPGVPVFLGYGPLPENSGKEMYLSGMKILMLKGGKIVKEIGEEGALAGRFEGFIDHESV